MKSDDTEDALMQPYNMFFKRVLHMAAHRTYELTDKLNVNEDI